MIRLLPLSLLLLGQPLLAADEAVVPAVALEPAVSTAAPAPAAAAPAASPVAPAPQVIPAAPATPVAPSAAVAKPAPVDAAAKSAIDAAMAEIALWNSLKSSENIADYRLYLASYPAGSFADLAEFRIRELETRRMLAESASLWQTLKDGEDLEGIESFLLRFPQSPLHAEAELKAQTLRPLTLIVHYIRRDQVLLGWRLSHTLSQTTAAFDRLDEVGAVAHLRVKAKLAARRSGLVLQRGEQLEDCAGQREIRWDRPSEVWLLEQDCTVYTSLAQAQKALQQRTVPAGSRRLHYVRRDAQENGWNFALRSDKLLGGLFSLGARKDLVPLALRDGWGVYADWKEQEGQPAAALLLELSNDREQKENCDKPLRWPAEAGSEAWYVSGSCTLLFRLEDALTARRKALAQP